MRTTLVVDDDVLAAARTLAAEQDTSIGRALSDLARRGMLPREPRRESSLPVFNVASDAPPITPNRVSDALDES